MVTRACPRKLLHPIDDVRDLWLCHLLLKTASGENRNRKCFISITISLYTISKMSNEEEPDRCWICLGSEDDSPPSQNSAKDSLIKVCHCSLWVHKKCLFDWAHDLDVKDGNNMNRTGLSNQNTVIFIQEFGPDNTPLSVVGYKATNGRRLYSTVNMVCPQCKNPIVLTSKPSYLLSMQALMVSVGRQVVAYGGTSVVVSTVGISAIASVLSIATGLGMKMLASVATESVAMKLLGNNEKTFELAFRKNKISFMNIIQLALFPVYTYNWFTSSITGYMIDYWYPLTFVNGQPFNPRHGVKRFLYFFSIFKSAYAWIYTVTFNKLFYRYLKTIHPFMGGKRLTLEETAAIDDENMMFEKHELMRLRRDQNRTAWYQRAWDWFFPRYYPVQKKILRNRRYREMKDLMERDFGDDFFEYGLTLKFLWSSLWPYAGSLVGDVLGKYTAINRLLIPYVETPAEGTYARNLIGMCLVMVGTDLVKLFLAWRQMKQFTELDIVDRNFTGMQKFVEVKRDHPAYAEFLERVQNNTLNLPDQGGLPILGGLYQFCYRLLFRE